MTVRPINKDDLWEYVEAAFDSDTEILNCYDKSQPVKTIDDVCRSIVYKIRNSFGESKMRGVLMNGKKVGYYVYSEDLLISFGLNREYRNRIVLPELWEIIKSELGDIFQCLLYSYNVRAIDWLKKCGMEVMFENVSLLRFENKVNLN